MKVGILSDTHDNVPLIQRAVALFKREGVDFVVHAGDFVAPFALTPILDLGIEFVGVFGNNDGEVLILTNRSEGRIHVGPHLFEVGEKRFLVTHYPDVVEAVAGGDTVDVVVYGHTHDPDLRRIGRTLVVNPGEGGGWTTGRPTAALLDLGPMDVRIADL